jgi:hypothetical protein
MLGVRAGRELQSSTRLAFLVHDIHEQINNTYAKIARPTVNGRGVGPSARAAGSICGHRCMDVEAERAGSYSPRSHPPPGRAGAESEARMSPGPSKPWTPLDDERLRSLVLAGMDANEIATELERTVFAVRARAEKRLRVSLKRVMVARRPLVELGLKAKVK